MSKLPPKAGVIPPKPRTAGGKTPQTRATTAAIAASTRVEEPATHTNTPGEGVVNRPSPINVQPSSADTSQKATYGIIAEMLTDVIQSDKLDAASKQNLVGIVKIAREAEAKEKDRNNGEVEQVKVSAIREAIRIDLVEMHNSLENQIVIAKEKCSMTLDNTSKILEQVVEAKTDAKDLAYKVNKVTDAADKIASDTSSYRNALLSKPTPSNKSNADPRILSDMECKAKQILVDIFDKDDNNILSKSLTATIEKANEAIAEIQDASKPKDIKVVAALKTRGQAVLLTLNSKEAAKWIREPGTKEEFANKFSTEAHIRERTYNLIVPRVPITFEPCEDKHLHEIEEANNLSEKAIRKVK